MNSHLMIAEVTKCAELLICLLLAQSVCMFYAVCRSCCCLVDVIVVVVVVMTSLSGSA